MTPAIIISIIGSLLAAFAIGNSYGYERGLRWAHDEIRKIRRSRR